jgi:ankyrin repeat protein
MQADRCRQSTLVLGGMILLACVLVGIAAGCARATNPETFKFPSTDSTEQAELQKTRKFLDNGGCVDALAGNASGAAVGQTRLHAAAYHGWAQVAELLLRHGADTEVREEGGITPLLVATRMSRADVAELLVEYGAQVNAADKNGTRPLDLAVHRKMPSTVKLLLEHGADPNGYGGGGYWPPVMAAAHNGSAEIVEMLIAHGGPVNESSGEPSKSLYWALAGGHSDIARILVQHGARTSAVTAAGVGDVAALRRHLTDDPKKARQVANDRYVSTTPLQMAAINGQAEATRVLLDAGADPNADCRDNLTPLDYAAVRGHADVVRVLVEKGANVEGDAAHQNNSPLHKAVIGEYVDTVEFLLDHGANVNHLDSWGQPPLITAAMTGNPSILKLLLDHGAEINARGYKGQTVLHVLGCNSKDDMTVVAAYLLEMGAEINARDETGLTPLDGRLATDEGAFLRAHGAKTSRELDAEAGPQNPPTAAKKGKGK